MNAPAPHQNFTFLFTDIERSSELWEKHPQAMGRALDQHDQLLRGIFEEHRGHSFKTLGDAFCVAFRAASDAGLAAIEAQRALAEQVWQDTEPLRVRMAIHSGEAELRDGDYFGPTLNRVARVLATGHGGQTLVTRTVAENLRVWLPPETSLRDLGERRLKDLSLPERIYQLDIVGLRSDFPPLRSLEVLPNNLPAQVTSFVGRAREMTEVKRLLESTRLLTLTGFGGTGKTRLSLQIAADVLDQFPHGVWLVELATISEPELVAEAIVNAVDVREKTDRPAEETLLDALRSRNLLIVLDNCEHLIAECARLVTNLLRHCPQVKILASSREPLNVAGETLWPVSALSMPSGHDDDLEIEDIEHMDAVQLFVERATLAKPDFHLTPENSALVARICWRLDGIPLAIELAAARVRVLPLPQILQRLDDRFRLLTGGSRTALPRQQTLGALIGWSYDLLSEPERILLRRLAVFVAGRTLEMTEEVCSGEGLERREIFDLLFSLTEKSLLMTETGPGGENRYTMLESIWDYADEKLTEHGETARYYRRHLDYFAAYAEEGFMRFFGPEQKEWIEKLGADHRNLLRALHTSLQSPDTIELGLRLAGSLSRYWEIRSYLTEGYEQFVTLLAAAPPSVVPEVRARAELGAGLLSWVQERTDDAIRHFEAARDLFDQAKNLEMVGVVEAYLSSTNRNGGNAAAAREHLERARQLAEQTDRPRLRALVLYGGSEAESDPALRRAGKEKAVKIFESLGDRWVAGLMKSGLAELCLQQKDYPAARGFLLDVLAISREFGSKWSIPYAIEGLAEICTARGKTPEAVRLYSAAAALRERLALNYALSEKKAFDESMTELRQRLDDAAVTKEWDAGKALALHSAIILATEASAN